MAATISLDDRLASDLDRVAKERGEPVDIIVSKALAAYLSVPAEPRSDEESANLPPGAGSFSSDRGDLSSRAETLLWSDSPEA